MGNPIRCGDTLGWPRRDFYRSWLRTDSKSPTGYFRKIWLSIRTQEPKYIAEHLFGLVQECSLAELSSLHRKLQKHQFHLSITSLDQAIRDFGPHGSLTKLKALFGGFTWNEFAEGLGLHESLSSEHMPLYANDVLQWYQEQISLSQSSGEEMPMLMSLQQCPCPVQEVVAVMQRIPTPDMLNPGELRQAMEATVSLIYDLTPDTSMVRMQELASHLEKLHGGWGIQYPAALLVQMMQEEHGKSFVLPDSTDLNYATKQLDIQLALLFQGKLPTQGTQEPVEISTARAMQALCDQKERFRFCTQGLDPTRKPLETIELPTEMFQEVGQP